MQRIQKRKTIDSNYCEEEETETENKQEDISSDALSHKKRKKNTKRTNEERRNEQAKSKIKKNMSLIELHTDALQYVLQFLSLIDRAKHIERTCKRLRTLSKETRIHHKHFGESMLKKLNKNPDAIDVAKRMTVESLYVSPLYNMQLMSVLAMTTKCLIAKDWNKKALCFTCPNATSLYFGKSHCCAMLNTNENPLSLVSFQRSLRMRNNTCHVLSRRECKALEECTKNTASFGVHLLVDLHQNTVRTELCCKALAKVTNLVINVRSQWATTFRFDVNNHLIVPNKCILPKLRSLEIQYWGASLRWRSLHMPNLEKLIINVVGNVEFRTTGANQFYCTHVLESVILIMTGNNCKQAMLLLRLQTKQLTLVYENYNFLTMNREDDAQLLEFISNSNPSLQYERLIIKSYDEYRQYDLINHKRFYPQARPMVFSAICPNTERKSYKLIY